MTELLLFAGLSGKHQQELENLRLTTQPFKTLKFFILAVVQYLKRLLQYLLGHGSWLIPMGVVLVAGGILLLNTDGPHEKVFWPFNFL